MTFLIINLFHYFLLMIIFKVNLYFNQFIEIFRQFLIIQSHFISFKSFHLY
jgi:hypothetical protein